MPTLSLYLIPILLLVKLRQRKLITREHQRRRVSNKEPCATTYCPSLFYYIL
jgi:hypothetical protein